MSGRIGHLAHPVLREFQTLNFSVATTTMRYIPFTGLSIATAINTYYVQRVAPAAGRLRRILCYADTAGGVTTWGIHKNGNVTPIEAVALDLPALTVVEIPFDLSEHFAAGDVLAISQDPTTAPTACTVQLEWTY